MPARIFVILAIIVSIMVGAIIWFLGSDPAVADSAPANSKAITTPRPADVPMEPKAVAHAISTSATPAPAPVQQPGPIFTEDDHKIGEIIRRYHGNSAREHTSAAQALINLLPTLAEDGQLQCARHIANLLSDDEFVRVMPVWRNPDFNPNVLEVLSADLMKRGHKVMLPAMVDAVRAPTHPFHEQAKNTLHILLAADLGDDAAAWDTAVKEFLKTEAEETKSGLPLTPR